MMHGCNVRNAVPLNAAPLGIGVRDRYSYGALHFPFGPAQATTRMKSLARFAQTR